VSLEREVWDIYLANQVCFNHDSITTSCKMVGASNNCPCTPSSSRISSPVARNKKPVRSCGWLENFKSICMCASVCLVNRFGMLMPQECRGPCAKACGKVRTNPTDGSPCAKIGDMIFWHCSEVSVVAVRGYISFLIITFRRLKRLSVHPNFEFFIFLFHSFAVSNRYVISVTIFPSGASLIPRVRWASDSSNLWIVTWHQSVSRIFMELGIWLLLWYTHL